MQGGQLPPQVNLQSARGTYTRSDPRWGWWVWLAKLTNPSTDRFEYTCPVRYTESDLRCGWLGLRTVENLVLTTHAVYSCHESADYISHDQCTHALTSAWIDLCMHTLSKQWWLWWWAVHRVSSQEDLCASLYASECPRMLLRTPKIAKISWGEHASRPSYIEQLQGTHVLYFG